MAIASDLKQYNYRPFKNFNPNQQRLRRHFKMLMTRYMSEPEPCLFLPSFMDLSRQLDCSSLDIHCALAELKKQGYDYFTLDIHSTVTIWHPSKMKIAL